MKILKENLEIKFDITAEFIPQVKNSTIVVNYEPEDKEIAYFLNCMEQCVKLGINPEINLKVNYNGYLPGFKVKKQLKRAMNDIHINDIVKLMVFSQSIADKKLEELTSLFLREADAK